MTLTVALEGRRAAEARMTEQCTITRGDGTGAYVEATMSYAAEGVTTIYAGKCRVKPLAMIAHQADSADLPVTRESFEVSVPISATGIRARDVITITTSSDGEAQGLKLRVFALTAGEQTTARRLTCELFT